ncbi:hypothetical protein E2562_015072 [Oryza meyeriana var. granulata]|uniref:Uncharacterized protein n=1 Tax=Oryza meyeriana var. granulata TaxID=110450 RepID=A0A6G1DVM4_9ORYZ|nr:hypothetical protein E2562_015072 [Oryza meyeriana var. granulata]
MSMFLPILTTSPPPPSLDGEIAGKSHGLGEFARHLACVDLHPSRRDESSGADVYELRLGRHVAEAAWFPADEVDGGHHRLTTLRGWSVGLAVSRDLVIEQPDPIGPHGVVLGSGSARGCARMSSTSEVTVV